MSDRLDQDGFPPPQDDFGTRNPFVSPATEARGEGYVTPTVEPLNPWVSMWTRPRACVRQQLDTDPDRNVLLLAMIAGAANQVANNMVAYAEEIAMRMASLIGVMAIGAIFMTIWLFVGGWLVCFAGRAIGGVASARECRTALAWCLVPAIWLGPINLAIGLYNVAVGPEAVFQPPPGKAPGNPVDVFALMPPWMIPWMVVAVIVGLWQFVITCQSVGEAHQFSSLRGLGTLILTFLAMMAIMLGVVILIGIIIGIVVALLQ